MWDEGKGARGSGSRGRTDTETILNRERGGVEDGCLKKKIRRIRDNCA